jgi:GNAT superfamily N-acetyltransferase
MSDFPIVKATPEEAIYVDSQLTDFVCEQVPFTQQQNQVFLNYVIKEDGVVIAGINADLYYWGMLYISEVFVNAKFRGRRLGSQLLLHLENEARKLGGTLSQCDTFDFLFKDFYLKHGYNIFGVLEDCPPGHQRYYLSKKLFK